MTVTVRDLRPEVRADIEGFVGVRHLATPFLLITPQSLTHDLTHMSPEAHYQPLVAVEDAR